MQIVLKKGESLTVRFTDQEHDDGRIDMDGDFIIDHSDDASITISTSWPDDQGRGGDDPIIYHVTAGIPEEGQTQAKPPLQSGAVDGSPNPPGEGDFGLLLKGEPTTACSVCGLPQFNSEGGITCPNGHGGADPLRKGVRPIEPRQDQCRTYLESQGKPHPKSGCSVCGYGGLTGCPWGLVQDGEEVTTF